MGWPATKHDGRRAAITASSAPSASICDSDWPSGAGAAEIRRQVERKLLAPAGLLQPALHPVHVLAAIPYSSLRWPRNHITADI